MSNNLHFMDFEDLTKALKETLKAVREDPNYPESRAVLSHLIRHSTLVNHLKITVSHS